MSFDPQLYFKLSKDYLDLSYDTMSVKHIKTLDITNEINNLT